MRIGAFTAHIVVIFTLCWLIISSANRNTFIDLAQDPQRFNKLLPMIIDLI